MFIKEITSINAYLLAPTWRLGSHRRWKGAHSWAVEDPHLRGGCGVWTHTQHVRQLEIKSGSRTLADLLVLHPPPISGQIWSNVNFSGRRRQCCCKRSLRRSCCCRRNRRRRGSAWQRLATMIDKISPTKQLSEWRLVPPLRRHFVISSGLS